MKFRTDFVTNSSSSSFITVKVESRRMQDLVGAESADELNTKLQRSANAFADGEWVPFSNDYRSLTEYFENLLQSSGEIEDCITGDMDDGDFQSVEIDHAEFADSSYGPFEYIKINGRKKLTITVEETYDDDAYKDEDIHGKEFFLIGSRDEFENYDEIVDCIADRGARITDSISDQTRYAVCASLDRNTEELAKIREQCIPILSESAFAYRWLNDNPYDDIYAMAYEAGFETDVNSWFEKYGFGDTSIEFLVDNKWIKKYDFSN